MDEIKDAVDLVTVIREALKNKNVDAKSFVEQGKISVINGLNVKLKNERSYTILVLGDKMHFGKARKNVGT